MPNDELIKSKIAPDGFASLLGGLCNAKSGMLIWYYVIFIFWIDGLVLWR